MHIIQPTAVNFETVKSPCENQHFNHTPQVKILCHLPWKIWNCNSINECKFDQNVLWRTDLFLQIDF